jgi:2-iminoacetate synthase ThiH
LDFSAGQHCTEDKTSHRNGLSENTGNEPVGTGQHKQYQVSWVTMGSGVAQVALQFGANDFGSTMIEENVVAAAGVRHRLSVEEIERTILDAGYEPRQRNMSYELVEKRRL